MSGGQPLDRFDLDEQSLVNEEIDAEGGIEDHAIEMNVYRTLAGNL